MASIISANKGSRPCYEEDTVAPRFGETLVHVYAAFTELFSSKLVSSTFFTRRRAMAPIAERGAPNGGESVGTNSPGARAAQSSHGSAGRQPRLLTKFSLLERKAMLCVRWSSELQVLLFSERVLITLQSAMGIHDRMSESARKNNLTRISHTV